MALTKNDGTQPKRVRVQTLRPWINVVRDTDTNEPIRREIEVGEVVEVDRILGGELVSCEKAKLVDPGAPIGKPKQSEKKAA